MTTSARATTRISSWCRALVHCSAILRTCIECRTFCHRRRRWHTKKTTGDSHGRRTPIRAPLLFPVSRDRSEAGTARSGRSTPHSSTGTPTRSTCAATAASLSVRMPKRVEAASNASSFGGRDGRSIRCRCPQCEHNFFPEAAVGLRLKVVLSGERRVGRRQACPVRAARHAKRVASQVVRRGDPEKIE